MSEQEPDRRRNIIIIFGETQYECSPENTAIYLHEGFDKHYDHIFLIENTNPDEEEAGVAFFRELIENFDEVVGFMRDREYSFVEKESVANFDKEMYRHYFGRDPLVPEPTPLELTPRQERVVEYLGHLLETEGLVAGDFLGEGDLHI